MKHQHTPFYKAAAARYQGQIEEAKAVIHTYLMNPVGIGEHSNLLDEVDKWVGVLAEAEERLQTLRNNFGEGSLREPRS